MELLNRAREESKEYRFFLKWNRLIPIIKTIDGNIMILLHLAESYTHGSGFFIKFNFDKQTGEIIEKYQRFGNFTQRF